MFKKSKSPTQLNAWDFCTVTLANYERSSDSGIESIAIEKENTESPADFSGGAFNCNSCGSKKVKYFDRFRFYDDDYAKKE
jgi:hypothetical protein